jgi:hypothetical protein
VSKNAAIDVATQVLQSDEDLKFLRWWLYGGYDPTPKQYPPTQQATE